MDIWLLFVLSMTTLGLSHNAEGSPFSFREATVHDIRIALDHNRLTSQDLVEFYLEEIRRLNPVLNGVIEVNPEALYLAHDADQDRKAKKPGSVTGLAGIPILLKDNIATKDKLNTTAGSYLAHKIFSYFNTVKVLTQYSEILAKTRQRGAVLVDIVDTASFDTVIASMYNDQFKAMNVEFKLALNTYLKQLITSPVRSLADAIVFNKKHSKLERIEEYGQDIFEAAEKTHGIGRMKGNYFLI
ncbi:unnamed protein product [Coffea canephora]|uniref:DH200=94 genomic scaffold, scaffold_271 n=1 Tax=Coffea canephora TaxID=49390 RepID=A0A068VDR6_COFCA|nr:unnamed protein product [Coffea canephora]